MLTKIKSFLFSLVLKINKKILNFNIKFGFLKFSTLEQSKILKFLITFYYFLS